MQIHTNRHKMLLPEGGIGLLLLLVLTNFVLAFLQYYYTPLDGDLAAIVLPSEHYSRVLQDPFGLSAVLHGDKYAAPNRFFVHGFMSVYFKQLPAFLQHFALPIDSVYLSCAVLKTAIQVLIGGLLAGFITGRFHPLRSDFLLALVLVLPLFQNTAYEGVMGIIMHSITYTCFYALPLGLLLLYYFLWQKGVQADGSFQLPVFQKAVLSVFAVVLAFSGPLIPPVVLIFGLLSIFYSWKRQNFTTPGGDFFKAIKTAIGGLPVLYWFFAGLCLYSLYLGSFNLENNLEIAVPERYVRLLQGLYTQLTVRLGLPLLLLFLGINFFILKRQKGDSGAQQVLAILEKLALFSIVYILLLPLGGYREYRPDIIRGDTMMPVVLALIYGFARSSFYLLHLFNGLYRRYYTIAVVLFLAVFINANWLDTTLNQCERAALEKMARSAEDIVQLDGNCTVMNWGKTTDYRQSEVNAQLLWYWGVTERLQYYYQK